MSENKAVFITKDIINENASILHVTFDVEEDWLFHGENNLCEENAAVVSLAQVLRLDSSIEELLEMSPGSRAVRTNAESPWQILN